MKPAAYQPPASVKLRKFAQFSKMWMACYTQEEIADAVGVTPKTVDNRAEDFVNLEALPKLQKLAALYEDADFKPPLYDIWNFSKNSNSLFCRNPQS